MARTTKITQTGNGSTVSNSDPIPVNSQAVHTSLSFDTDGSTTGFTAQYTLENPQDYDTVALWVAGAAWHNGATIAAVTAINSETITGPITGVRLQANATGTDTGTLVVLQVDE